MNPTSKKARKQRAFFFHLPLHVRQKRLSVHASDAIHKETKKRAVPVRKGDTVKVLRGDEKGKSGKVTGTNYQNQTVFIEKILRKKAGGKEVAIPIQASNLLLVELNREDEARLGAGGNQKKTKAPKAPKAKEAKTKETEKGDIWSEEKTSIASPTKPSKGEK